MSRSHENTDLYILKAVWQKIILSKILLLNKILLLIYLKYVQTDIFTSDLCLLSKIILYLANLCAYQLYEICPNLFVIDIWAQFHEAAKQKILLSKFYCFAKFCLGSS